MCIAGEDAGFSLLNRIRNTEALYLNNSRERRSPRFVAIERPLAKTTAAAGGWPAGYVGSSRVDLQACKLEYSIVSPK